MSTNLMHAHASLYTDVPSKKFKSSFSPGRFVVYYKIRPYKNTADNKLKKKRFLCLKTLSMSNQFGLV